MHSTYNILEKTSSEVDSLGLQCLKLSEAAVMANWLAVLAKTVNPLKSTQNFSHSRYFP